MPSDRMRVPVLCSAIVGLVVTCCGQNTPSANNSGWRLVWSDEFNGPALDRSRWVAELGGGGWGNQELEYYTDRDSNVSVQNGNLVITARSEKYTGPDGVTRNYTSARLKTLGTFSQIYGRFEARIKLPAGEGMWPAFWILGDDIERVGWPACGEIDIMENIGKEPSVIHGSIHGPGYTGETGIEARYKLTGEQHFSDDFHIYAVEWDSDSISFFVDHNLYVRRTRADLKPGWKWAFDKPFFLLLNVAVGGDWPGSPDATTIFPQRMLVDYVRVYRRSEPATKQEKRP
jgi:beta-glucanase (GH16 family)